MNKLLLASTSQTRKKILTNAGIKFLYKPPLINEEEGKRICGYAATAKSTTLLNYCSLNSEIIDYICDTTSEKINKYSPGMHIPIVSMSHFYKNLPDVAYLFAWNHKKEIFF